MGSVLLPIAAVIREDRTKLPRCSQRLRRPAGLLSKGTHPTYFLSGRP